MSSLTPQLLQTPVFWQGDSGFWAIKYLSSLMVKNAAMQIDADCAIGRWADG